MLDKLRMEQAGTPPSNNKVLRGLESGSEGDGDQVYSSEIISLKVGFLLHLVSLYSVLCCKLQ